MSWLQEFLRNNRPHEPVSELPPPPIPSALPAPMPDINWTRWDWEQDIQPYLRWRLENLLRDLLTTADAEQMRYKQGRAQELYEILSARDVEQWRARQRAQNERERTPNGR